MAVPRKGSAESYSLEEGAQFSEESNVLAGGQGTCTEEVKEHRGWAFPEGGRGGEKRDCPGKHVRVSQRHWEFSKGHQAADGGDCSGLGTKGRGGLEVDKSTVPWTFSEV